MSRLTRGTRIDGAAARDLRTHSIHIQTKYISTLDILIYVFTSPIQLWSNSSQREALAHSESVFGFFLCRSICFNVCYFASTTAAIICPLAIFNAHCANGKKVGQLTKARACFWIVILVGGK